MGYILNPYSKHTCENRVLYHSYQFKCSNVMRNTANPIFSHFAAKTLKQLRGEFLSCLGLNFCIFFLFKNSMPRSGRERDIGIHSQRNEDHDAGKKRTYQNGLKVTLRIHDF